MVMFGQRLDPVVIGGDTGEPGGGLHMKAAADRDEHRARLGDRLRLTEQPG
ncbi:hypothetical protein [Streptomyces mirabilis]|uniref:hypothetical protein n=1 Tax=Streptomyces mirabilis TaxID=68239 RepID=UPI0036956864